MIYPATEYHTPDGYPHPDHHHSTDTIPIANRSTFAPVDIPNYSLAMVSPYGIQRWTVSPGYGTYKSPFGPKYRATRNFYGINLTQAIRFGRISAGFAGVAGFFALFFFAEVPRISKDVMQRIPLIGEHFVHEVPPEDNPF